MEPLSNVTELIGNTPLVKLGRIYQGKGTLYAKAEYVNPGGSIKDRVAKRIIEDAYREGKLKPGQPVFEMTGGNTGAGLAVVCNTVGNPFYAYMSIGQSIERARMLEAMGTHVVLVPQVDGSPGKVTGNDIKRAEILARTECEKSGGFFVDQFRRPGGVLAHFEGTGPEILSQLPTIDVFVSVVGSGGTLIGCSKFLKKRKSHVLSIAVEPRGCEFLAGKEITKTQHIIQGVGYGLIPQHWQKEYVDQFISVSDEEVRKTTRDIAQLEGHYVGYSSGANVAASIKILQQMNNPELNIVTILCDTGFKYSDLGEIR